MLHACLIQFILNFRMTEMINRIKIELFSSLYRAHLCFCQKRRHRNCLLPVFISIFFQEVNLGFSDNSSLFSSFVLSVIEIRFSPNKFTTVAIAVSILIYLTILCNYCHLHLKAYNGTMIKNTTLNR